MNCPICGKGELVMESHETDGVFGLLHSICDYCAEWIVTPEQSRYNKRIILSSSINKEINQIGEVDVFHS